jgi:serine/threonine protein kinase
MGARRYKVQKQLGSGAFATVFLAAEQPTGSLVAVKLQPLTRDDSIFLEQEYFSLMKLMPVSGVVRPLGYIGAPALGWSAMLLEYLPGPSVANVAGALSLEERAQFLSDMWPMLSNILNQAHKLGVFHGDVKLSHFLFRQPAVDWRSPSAVVLIDW